MTSTPEPNFEERSKEVGIDRAALELMLWQDEQRNQALDEMVQRNRAAK